MESIQEKESVEKGGSRFFTSFLNIDESRGLKMMKHGMMKMM